MNLDFDKKKFTCKFDYCIGKAADLNDPSLQAKAVDYKRRLSGSMRALSGSDIAAALPISQAILESPS